jgi:hypothetical protein
MAELICKDGTKIKISDETEQELRKAFGEAVYPVGTLFYRDEVPHIVKLLQTKGRNAVYLTDAEGFVCGDTDCLHDKRNVKDVNKVPMSIIKQLTMYPAGLRAIKRVKVVEDC